MAVAAALDPKGRKWPKQRVDIIKFLAEAMRSITYNEARKLESGTQPRLVPETDLQSTGDEASTGSVLEPLLEPVPGAEELLIEAEREARNQARLTVFRAQLATGTRQIGEIFERRLQGFSKVEIREQLGMSDKDFWTADRRLTRRIEELLKQLENDDT